MRNKVILLGVILATVLFTIFANNRPIKTGEEVYSPQINPAEFSTNISNPYLVLPIGKKFVYEGKVEEGKERNEIVIKKETREILGVTTLIYHDKVYLNGELIEDTEDYLAQDKDGNIWYFGEEVDNYKRGKLKDHSGSWIAGIDGAKPGILIKAKHVVGDTYRQEYYKGEAEDTTEVIAVDQTVTVPYGTFGECVKMYDSTPLDQTSREYKYYCPGVGGLVMVENIETGEKAELIEVDSKKTYTPVD